jgi:cell division transport system ATP-binding protein
LIKGDELIRFSYATKIYENGTRGIQDVNLEIDDEEFVFVVGQSGSGKSTLIKTLLREQVLTDGEVVVDGINLSALTKAELPYYRRRVGVVFQDFRLLPNKTVYENVAFAMQIVQASHREIRQRVPRALALVGLQKKTKAYPNQLSGGEQQRVALARAIINNPPLLIADEPTGNLDPGTAWEILRLLEEINNEGTTVVVATHAWDMVKQMDRRVITLKNGFVVRDAEGGALPDEA